MKKDTAQKASPDSIINLFVKDYAMRIALIVFILLISSCVQQQAEIKEISIAGHGNQIYVFSYDIRESVKVPSSNEAGIRNLIHNSSRITIIFNSTAGGEEKSMFQQMIINVAEKLQAYFSYEGRILNMDVLYYAQDGLYNKSNKRVDLLANTKMLLLGPDTGAKETSVRLDGNTIILQGKTRKDLILAGDKLALIVMGIDEEKIKRDILGR